MNQKRVVAGMVGTVVLMGSVAVGHAQKSPLAQAAYARAQKHLAESRFNEAATEMETAVRYEPRFAMGWYVLASAERRAKRCDEAVFAYRRYMELRPAEADPYFGAALCLQTVGDLEGAAAAFRHYVETENRASSREFVATARQHLAELERARGAAAKGAPGGAGPPAAPSPATPLLKEARQLREHGHPDEAIARYRSALAADPKSADAPTELGALLVSMRRAPEAVDPLRAAVHLAPTAASAWYNLAFALRESGQAAEAVAAYRRYITFRPQDPDPHYGLARALTTLGQQQEALAAFRNYVTLEKRPTEGRWVKKARLEISRIESNLAGPSTGTNASAAPGAGAAPGVGAPARVPPKIVPAASGAAHAPAPALH